MNAPKTCLQDNLPKFRQYGVSYFTSFPFFQASHKAISFLYKDEIAGSLLGKPLDQRGYFAVPSDHRSTSNFSGGRTHQVQSGAATCTKGFVQFFLGVPQGVGLYCSCYDTQARGGNISKPFRRSKHPIM